MRGPSAAGGGPAALALPAHGQPRVPAGAGGGRRAARPRELIPRPGRAGQVGG